MTATLRAQSAHLRPPASGAIAFILGAVTGMMLLVVAGCGGAPVRPDVARIALLRLELSEIVLDDTIALTGDDAVHGDAGTGEDAAAAPQPPATLAELDQRYRVLHDRALVLDAWGLAADVTTFWGRLYEDRQLHEEALEKFRLALRYDKLAHYEARTETNPYPNSADIATTLTNIAVAYENLGDINQSADYAFRAFQINRVLGYLHRLSQDCTRLAHLHELLGNPDRASQFLTFKSEVDLLLAAGTTWAPMNPEQGPGPR